MPELLDTTGFTCPWCNYELVLPNTSHPAGLEPVVGNYAVCFNCRQIGVYRANGIRKPTKAEQAAMKDNPMVAKVTAVLALLAEYPLIAVEVIRDDATGEYQVISDLLTPEAVAQLEATLKEDELDRRARELAENVTPEVANHVLAVYGDEEASWPSASVSALIQLIRTCMESDDELLLQINNVPRVHGYVLGVHVAEREKRGASSILRKIAGLGPIETTKET